MAVSEDENEALMALIALGYAAKDARSAVAKAVSDKAQGTEEILKAALRYM